MEKPKILITGGSGFIGTNLVERFIQNGYEVLNLDILPPRNKSHQPFWKKIDINEREDLANVVQEFRPKFILHFAARTDLRESESLAGYSENYIGVRNLIFAVKNISTVERIIFASSQLVCKIGYQPLNEDDYCPTTLYGTSKVIGEQIIRSVDEFGASWTIVRPTSIWGPWFGEPYRDFFDVIKNDRKTQAKCE